MWRSKALHCVALIKKCFLLTFSEDLHHSLPEGRHLLGYLDINQFKAKTANLTAPFTYLFSKISQLSLFSMKTFHPCLFYFLQKYCHSQGGDGSVPWLDSERDWKNIYTPGAKYLFWSPSEIANVPTFSFLISSCSRPIFWSKLAR